MIIFSSHRMEHVELFCEKLVVLVKGKTVLKGDLKQIKKDYRKKNIYIECSSLDINKLKELEGVINIKEENGKLIVKIEDESYLKTVFNFLKQYDDVREFSLHDATLNEIFLEKVGKNYDE